jgi:hypothetical protein
MPTFSVGVPLIVETALRLVPDIVKRLFCATCAAVHPAVAVDGSEKAAAEHDPALQLAVSVSTGLVEGVVKLPGDAVTPLIIGPPVPVNTSGQHVPLLLAPAFVTTTPTFSVGVPFIVETALRLVPVMVKRLFCAICAVVHPAVAVDGSEKVAPAHEPAPQLAVSVSTGLVEGVVKLPGDAVTPLIMGAGASGAGASHATAPL